MTELNKKDELNDNDFLVKEEEVKENPSKHKRKLILNNINQTKNTNTISFMAPNTTKAKSHENRIDKIKEEEEAYLETDTNEVNEKIKKKKSIMKIAKTEREIKHIEINKIPEYIEVDRIPSSRKGKTSLDEMRNLYSNMNNRISTEEDFENEKKDILDLIDSEDKDLIEFKKLKESNHIKQNHFFYKKLLVYLLLFGVVSKFSFPFIFSYFLLLLGVFYYHFPEVFVYND